MPQLATITTGRATSRKRRWPYQASVMKAFETTSNAAAVRPSRYPPPPIPASLLVETRRSVQCSPAAGATRFRHPRTPSPSAVPPSARLLLRACRSPRRPSSMEERAEHARRERCERADRHLRVGDDPAHRELDAPEPAARGLVVERAEEGNAPGHGVEAEVGWDHRAAQVERGGVLADRTGKQDADPVGGADPAVADRDRLPLLPDLGPGEVQLEAFPRRQRGHHPRQRRQ